MNGIIFIIMSNVSCFYKTNSVDKKFKLEVGLKLELIVEDPLVIYPVAFSFDEQGYFYVVEFRGYPNPVEGGTAAIMEGRIVRLEVKDGDGQYDRSELASGFTPPNGILPWNGGVFVICALDVFYSKDSYGYGKADTRQVVLTGCRNTKTSQLRVSDPTLGSEVWIYVTSGLYEEDVASPLLPNRDTVFFTASDGQFHPEIYEFETVGGKSQFGLTFDAFGNRFGCSNHHLVLQVVIEPKYLNHNPYLSFSQTVKNASKVEAEAVAFPISNVPTTSDFMVNLIGRFHQGTYTAASSTFIFEGRGICNEHRGNVFLCESAQIQVQRQILKPDGPSFKSELAYKGQEFLASKDEWFRPVYLNHGPDGGMYLADMHSKVLDHRSYVLK